MQFQKEYEQQVHYSDDLGVPIGHQRKYGVLVLIEYAIYQFRQGKTHHQHLYPNFSRMKSHVHAQGHFAQ